MSISDQVEAAMKQHPVGLIVAPGSTSIMATFWIDRPIAPGVMYENLLSGIAQQALDHGILSKDGLLKQLATVLKERQ